MIAEWELNGVKHTQTIVAILVWSKKGMHNRNRMSLMGYAGRFIIQYSNVNIFSSWVNLFLHRPRRRQVHQIQWIPNMAKKWIWTSSTLFFLSLDLRWCEDLLKVRYLKEWVREREREREREEERENQNEKHCFKEKVVSPEMFCDNMLCSARKS